MTADTKRPTVADVTRAALAFIDAHGLEVPGLNVTTRSATAMSVDPQQTGPSVLFAQGPPGQVNVCFVQSAPAFLAWARALGAVRVLAERSATQTHVSVRVWRDGISWLVVGYLPHEHGTPHLAGSDVTWSGSTNPKRARHGVLTVDGLAAAYPAEVPA